MSKQYFTYILASKPNGVLYVGVTDNLAKRGDQHKSGTGMGLTSKYHVRRLVYDEAYDKPDEAIQREKNIKAWKRNWKIKLIEPVNPNWQDLAVMLLD